MSKSILFKAFLPISVILTSIFLSFSVHADQELISLFPIENYDQDIAHWVHPEDPDHEQSLLSEDMQKKHMARLWDHYYGNFSPWNENRISQISRLQSPNDLQTLEQYQITKFNNINKEPDLIGYGSNFRPLPNDWITAIDHNINFSEFSHITYEKNNRAIAIDNLNARVLPTDEVHFYHYKIPGQGYPFDNLQMSNIWAGTPLYILGETIGHEWALVLTPDFIGWVHSNGIARATDAFIQQWTLKGKVNLAAILQTKTAIMDQDGLFRFSAYIGSFFPAVKNGESIQLTIPISDKTHQAQIAYSTVTLDQAALMPLKASPHYFSVVMNKLLGRPYGWGGMYFYNDCSAELKHFLTPFGIWVPRHSSDQVYAGKMIDVSNDTPEKRLAYLMDNGHRFLTIVYIGGHVFLYIGNFENPHTHSLMAMTYQNMWGMSPNPATSRAVIGQSVLFPALLQYPENTTLRSPVDKKYFQISLLDENPNFLLKLETIDLRAMMDMS